ncbi:DNA helicase [Oceanicola sp. S124]|uniref:DNA helicase n=1 Tax=Oceanicola sp. S124 TaxID=1042378 RepID=UPI0002558CAA|nr:DNA helicase [Oceanicola sp. S124]
MHLSAPIFRLKRQARLTARTEGIPLSRALDRLARAEGYARWSELAARAAETPPGAALLGQLHPGDLLLLAARPQQGKTLTAVQMLIAAAAEGRGAHLFTLEDSAAQAAARIRGEGGTPEAIAIDTSDEISASHIITALRLAPAGSLAVIDYLQLLDQRRDKPDLARQVTALRAFAQASGVILCALSQIDRHYDPATRPLPDVGDLRLPNRLDPALFTRHCFLQGGRLHMTAR